MPGRKAEQAKGTGLSWLGGLIGRRTDRDRAATLPLYEAVVARAREPHWYLAGAVPDTVDGRFDMVAAVLALVLLRLEAEPEGAEPGARLTEWFVEDMDGQLREFGIGDIVVGKHIGKMMSMLGGRLGAYRDGVAGGDLEGAVLRNVYRGIAPSPDALAHVAGALRDLHARLRGVSIATLLEGVLP